MATTKPAAPTWAPLKLDAPLIGGDVVLPVGLEPVAEEVLTPPVPMTLTTETVPTEPVPLGAVVEVAL